jgi:ketosteroid isomerase-like protein
VPAIDAATEVLAANRAFYEAFETRDMDAMSDVWEHSPRVSCLHPGWSRLDGWGSIAASFFGLFDGGAPLQFILTGERVEVTGLTAWVTVDENILNGEASATAAAVNVFVRHPDGWRMVLHHASHVLGNE